MKTAEEIYTELGCSKKSEIIESMKEYAKQVAEHTLIKASTRVYSKSTMDMGIKESIRSTPIVTP